jgi:hypothetical protein
MATTKYNLAGKIDDFIKVAEKAIFEATRANARIDKLPTPEPIPAPQKGERGPAGPAGRDGKDSTVPGPPGANGPQGASVKGDRGERGTIGPDTAEAIAGALAAVDDLRREVAEVKLENQALRDMNTKARDYVDFLRARVEARRSKQQ